MNMPTFTKLFSDIVTSSLWSEDDKTRLLFVTMLAICDQHGEVYAALPGLARVANMDLPACEAAVAKLESPDPYSRTKEHEGRRIEKIDGGWRILNYRKHRMRGAGEDRKEYKREYMRGYMRDVRQSNTSNKCLTSASVYSASVEDLEGRVGKDAEELPMPDAKASSEALQALMTAFRIKPLDASLQAIRGNVVELLARGATVDEIADLAAWATDDEVALKAGVPLTAVSLTDPARFAGFQSTMRRHLAEIEAERKKRNR